MEIQTNERRTPNANSTYPKGGVSCTKDSFVVNQTLIFQIKFCGKRPTLRVAANRWCKRCGRQSIITNSERQWNYYQFAT